MSIDLTKEQEDTRKKVEYLDDKEMLIQKYNDKVEEAKRLGREIWTLKYQIDHFDEIQNYFKPPDPPQKTTSEDDNKGGSGREEV